MPGYQFITWWGDIKATEEHPSNSSVLKIVLTTGCLYILPPIIDVECFTNYQGDGQLITAEFWPVVEMRTSQCQGKPSSSVALVNSSVQIK